MPASLSANLQGYVDQAIIEHNIPALSLAVWQNGQQSLAAAGCLNLNTGVKATPDSIFQIGSITKVMTASLVMQLVDEGKVELDAPVKAYVRDFGVADSKATNTITVRQLLNHTNGMAGDYFPDDRGHEGNLIARYVDRCNLLPLVHSPGVHYSYSNSAFAVAGRLIEVVRGMSWYQVMNAYLFQPLGMQQAIADPTDIIRHRCAMGHVYDGDNTDLWVLSEQAYFTLGMAAAGITPSMSAENLILFARAHMEEGKNQKGEAWLSPASIALMQTPHIELPRMSPVLRKHVGLGWGIHEYLNHEGLQVMVHSGATNGFLSMLQCIPERNIAFAILINGFRPSALEALTNNCLSALMDVSTQYSEPASDKTISELEVICGVYESFNTRISVNCCEQKLTATIIYKLDPLPPLKVELQHESQGCFAACTKDGQRVKNIVFLEQDTQGIPQYLFSGGRQNRRVK